MIRPTNSGASHARTPDSAGHQLREPRCERVLRGVPDENPVWTFVRVRTTPRVPATATPDSGSRSKSSPELVPSVSTNGTIATCSRATRVTSMRTSLSTAMPDPTAKLIAMNQDVEGAAADAGVDQTLLELVKLRASQLNGCAFCLDMHANGARAHGETQQRLDLLPAWRETDLFDETERAALELTEAITRLSETANVPEETYRRARAVFDEHQYAAVAWQAIVINAFNRMNVTSRAQPAS